MSNLELTPGNVKAAMKSADASSSDLWKVSPDQIHVIPDFNVRIHDAAYEAHIRRLADSMKAEGFYPDKPLAGYVAALGDNVSTIMLTDGHSRLAAAKLAIAEGAEIQKLPIVVSAKGTSTIDLTVALVKGNSGQPLKPYEIAVVCKRLARFGWDSKQIAARLDYTTAYVDDLLMLMAAPGEIHQSVILGEMSLTTAVGLVNEHGNGGVVEYLQQCKKVAAAAGSKKITAKTLPGAAIKAYAKKNANLAFGALKLVRADPAYQNLDASLRKKLDTLLAEAEKAGKK